MSKLEGLKIGFAMCGSFCTFSKAFDTARRLKELGADVIPVMSFNACTINSRFGTAEENIKRFEEITGHKIICSISEAEPIGPKKLFDVLAVCPCTGNTLAKLAGGITDTPVTMAVKSHIRNSRPVILAVATNDALAAGAQNIGALLNRRCFYFVPFGQDDYEKKPRSIIADFNELPDTISDALDGIQKQPLMM